MKLLKNENGVALIAVVLVMAVSVILGTAVLSFALSDTRLAENQEHHLQAEYIARAGADAAAQYVQNHPSEFPTGGFIDRTFTDPSLGEGSFSATISQPFQGGVLVTSTGTAAGASATVTLSLTKGSYSGQFNGIRQTQPETDLDLGALPITYDAGAQVLIEGHVQNPLSDIKLSTANESDPNIQRVANYDAPGTIVVPDSSDFHGTVETHSVGKGKDKQDITTVTGNVDTSSLVSDNQTSIVFDTGKEDQIVIVNSLEFKGPQGSVTIIGSGTVQLYIKNGGEISTPIVANVDGSPSQLFIYVCDGGTLDLGSNSELSAYIAAPQATIIWNANATTINGAIIGNIIEKNTSGSGPHGNFHFVPLPNSVNFSGLLTYVRNHYSN